MKKNNILVTLLLAFGFLLRFIPLLQNRGVMSTENLYSNLIASILAVPILFLVYLISKEASGSEKAALFSLVIASVIPLYSWKVSEALTSAIGSLFFFFILYLIPRMKKKKYYLLAIAFPFLYLLFNPCGWIFIPILAVYYILIRVEHLKQDKIENYFLYISLTGLVLLTIALSYSGSITYIVRTNLLEFLHLSSTLSSIGSITLSNLFHLVGSLPLLFGVLGAYLAMKKEERMPLLLFSAIGGSFLVTLLLGKIFSYIYLSLSMACLASFSYLVIRKRLDESRLHKFTNIILLVITAIIILSGISRWVIV